jgi:hypothetical protein
MGYPRVSAGDALHLAIMEGQDIEQILSFDSALMGSPESHVCRKQPTWLDSERTRLSVRASAR